LPAPTAASSRSKMACYSASGRGRPPPWTSSSHSYIPTRPRRLVMQSSVRPVLSGPFMRAAIAFVAALVLLGALSPGRSAQAAPRQVQGGALDWGIKASFRSYITGPIAHGAMSATGGASQNADGTFRFPVSGGGSYDSATGALTLSFSGGVHF